MAFSSDVLEGKALASGTVSIRQANQRGSSSRERCQQLLPGIPDDITLREITPKLPWKDFHILSAVSRTWDHAIRSREVYDARVLSHSTEEFVIVNLHLFRGGIGLWSTRDNYLIKLPRIGHRSQHLVSFDGRIYLLGREVQGMNTLYDSIISDKVFVSDVAAGESGWTKCASMREKRRDFTGAVIDGKIYVCGGGGKFFGSEVYNPKKDLWSPFKAMSERYYNQTEAVGEELFVHGGFNNDGSDRSSFLDIYHPGKDEWRVVSTRNRGADLLFVARGKLHLLDNSRIDFYNADENSWTNLHKFSCIELDVCIHDERTAVVHVDDELLIRYWVRTGRDRKRQERVYKAEKVCLAKSKGFGKENKEIVWQKVPLTHSEEKLFENTRTLTTIML